MLKPSAMRSINGRRNKRHQIWQSLRILRRFTLPDVCRTIPGGISYATVSAFITSLTRHGYLNKVPGYSPGRAGNYQIYILVRDVGPAHPIDCFRCKKPLFFKACETEERETKKETKKAEEGGS